MSDRSDCWPARRMRLRRDIKVGSWAMAAGLLLGLGLAVLL